MRYYVTIGERTFEVDLTADGIEIDGERVDAELAGIQGTPVRHLLVDGRSQVVAARQGEERGDWTIHLNGTRSEVRVIDERTKTIEAMTGASAAQKGPQPVRAPMPGLVVRVDVELGQVVEAGEGVVIVEAMKMENELRAESGGTVTKILVEPGQAVEKGAVLIEFEG